MKKKQLTINQRNAIRGWAAILPALLLTLLIFGYPAVQTVIKSFTSWNGIGKAEYIGLKNYIKILGDPQFWQLLKNTFVFLLFLPAQLFFGIVVAVLIYEEIPGWRIFRIVYYIPQVISTMVIGYIFSVMFGFNGPLNRALMGLGFTAEPIRWLEYGGTARTVVIICMVWINIGWQSILALGGLSSIPTSVYEAAELDGAGYWKRLFYITLPMLGRTIEYSCIVSVMWVFAGLFPLIFSLTSGGPGHETSTLDYMIYLKSFSSSSKYGYASALSVILIIIVIILSIIQFKISDRQNSWEG